MGDMNESGLELKSFDTMKSSGLWLREMTLGCKHMALHAVNN